jgi:hypothetical protein
MANLFISLRLHCSKNLLQRYENTAIFTKAINKQAVFLSETTKGRFGT